MALGSEGESAAFLAICQGDAPPDAAAYAQGWDAHEQGRAFHEYPYPFDTVLGLSWRLGWNERALWKLG
jgi:hypothetical protein